MLLKIIKDSKTDSKLKIEVRKNFIINCVTALEFFLKDMIEGLIELNAIDKKNIDKFLDDKITLKEAWKIFSERSITLGEIISATCSFQNLHQINSILSGLFDRDFLDEIDYFQVERGDENTKYILKKDYPDWRKRITEMFELPHKFVKDEIPQLWFKFGRKMNEIKHRIGPAYGVRDNYDEESGEFDYVAGIGVDSSADIPENMVRIDVPEQTYVVFTCTLPTLVETFQMDQNSSCTMKPLIQQMKLQCCTSTFLW